MKDPFTDLPEAQREKLEKQSHPDWTAPMLARLTHDHFSDPDWIFERKLDGERALAFRDGARTRLLSRNRKELGDTYPEVVEALASQAADDFVVDGEVVAFEGNVTSFSRLQGRMQTRDQEAARNSGVAVYYYVFDLVHLAGRGLEQLPLRSRKALLKKNLNFSNRLRFSAHRNERGKALLKDACRRGWEGLIAKRADSSYQHGRSSDWLKFKCSAGQELVIGGYTSPKGTREGFGALLLGYYEDGSLRYAGRVGTGFDDELLRRLKKKMDRIRRKTSPFDEEIKAGDVTWVAPKLVAEIGFTEWTGSGKLRHPRFLGLRRDKSAREVVREEPGAQ
jgi:DNA ligase D-like protein (predicted ligase)